MQKFAKIKNKDLKLLTHQEQEEYHYRFCLSKIIEFIKPIEEKFTGLGLPILFSFLSNRTGTGNICTSPMGAGKTIIAIFIEYLMKLTNFADYVIPFQEFKKTDWMAIFPERRYENEFFHFSIQEISAVGEYSEALFWDKIPTLMTDGSFLYRSSKDDDDVIQMTNCRASFFIASQPPKTHHIINNETFRTLANDRTWNIILLNQMRSMRNSDLSEVEGICEKIPLFNKAGNPRFFRSDIDKIKYLNTNGSKVSHLTEVDWESVKEFENIVRNQFSVARRYSHMNNIILQFANLLNIKLVRQVHLWLFLDLFSLYIDLYNKLTIGSVEQSVDIRYGAVEMLCRINDLKTQDKIITQKLLCKEFNTSVEDVREFLNELVYQNIIQESEPVGKAPTKRSKRKKSSRAVREQTNKLIESGLITKRFASRIDAKNNSDVQPREVIYEFSSLIDEFFKFYAEILASFLSDKDLKSIPQINKFLPSDQTSEVPIKTKEIE